MKQKLLYLLALCWLLPAMATFADNDRNVLSFHRWIMEPWEETAIPIYLENTCDTATAIQFTLTMPGDVVATLKAGDMTDRLPNHHLSVQKESGVNSWTVMAHSDVNAFISGSNGIVFYLNCIITKTNGRPSVPIFISEDDAVLSDIKGKNVLTDVVVEPIELVSVTSFKCSPSYVNHVVTVGQELTRSFKLINHSSYRLNNLTIEAVETSECCGLSVSLDKDYLDEGEEMTVYYTLTGVTASSHTQHLKLNISTAEEVTTEFSINCQVKDPVLVAYLVVDHLYATIPVGTIEPVTKPVNLKNEGTAETGPISVAIGQNSPLSLITPQPLESIPVGGEAEMLLNITLPANAVSGQSFTGQIVLKPENGVAVPLKYTVTAVETRTGKLIVDVIDDYTLATDNGPHVSGATVKVLKPFSDVDVAEGVTDENGKVTFDNLIGGSYRIKVSADRHKEAKVNTFVNVGEDNEKQVYLEIAGVELDWGVEKDPITDENNIEVKTVVETNIPAPSIDITLPRSKPMPNAWFPIMVENKNTTTAFDLEFWLETDASCTVEFLNNPYKDKLVAGEKMTLYAKLVAVQLPNVMTLKCSTEYTYALSNNPKTGTAWAKKTYGSTAIGNSSGGGCGGSSGYTGAGGLGPYDNAPLTTSLKGSDGMPTTAKIKIQLSQNLTMTREAFTGTLTINNGETVNLENIQLNLTITNTETGEVASSDKFAVVLETLDTFEGTKELGAVWTLAGGATGIARIRFVPTDLAAPEGPVYYDFGGTLTYRFADEDQSLTNVLLPVTLTVNPSPMLMLDYFLEPDIMGDDLLTPDVEESSEPAELALLITNKGHGKAENVTLTTEQPRITENIDEVPLVLKIAEAWMNGEQLESPTQTMPFGTIESGKAVYAKWMLSCNLMGRFDEYEVEVNNVSAYPSLIGRAQVHELVMKSFVVDEESKLTAFLANDDKDDDHWPEMLYLSDGTTAPVTIGQMTIDDSSASECYIDLTSPSDGWVYWRIDAPVADGDVKDMVCDDDYEVLWQQNYRVYKDEEEGVLKYKREVHIIGHPGVGTWGLRMELNPVTTSVASQSFTDNDGWKLGRVTADGCLMLKGNWEQVASLWVVDGAGRQRQVTGNREKGVEVAHLLPGVYILKIVTTDGSIVAKKFVKAN